MTVRMADSTDEPRKTLVSGSAQPLFQTRPLVSRLGSALQVELIHRERVGRLIMTAGRRKRYT